MYDSRETTLVHGKVKTLSLIKKAALVLITFAQAGLLVIFAIGKTSPAVYYSAWVMMFIGGITWVTTAKLWLKAKRDLSDAQLRQAKIIR
jgi:hypothetical protein